MTEVNYTYVRGRGWVPESRTTDSNSRIFTFKGRTWRMAECDGCIPGILSWTVGKNKNLIELSDIKLQDYARANWSRSNSPGISYPTSRQANSVHRLYVFELVDES